MATEKEYQGLLDRIAALRETLSRRLSADLSANPGLADAVSQQVDDMLAAVVAEDRVKPAPPDLGLAKLAGIGPEAADEIGEARMPQGVEVYDEQVTSERLIAVGDLYYLYQHERIGVFRVVQKLQELFKGGAIRLSAGPGAFALYQFDRRGVLRYTRRDRMAAYHRVLGYGRALLPAGARANIEFHRLFTHFVNQVALYWRDKRISDVLRERAYDPTFGSIAVVRRAGLDLRNNLKFTSYGHLNVLRVEVMQLLDEAFRILNADDVKRLFGADNAWDVIEEVLSRYFRERLVTSARQRMGVAGREVLRWLAQPHILQQNRVPFEAMLQQIAEPSEEWITSAQAMGLTDRVVARGVLPWERPERVGPPRRRATRPPGNHVASQEFEFEL